MKHLKITEDWERESLKDFVYLCEQQMLLEQEFQRVIREPAQIIVIDKDKNISLQVKDEKNFFCHISKNINAIKNLKAHQNNNLKSNHNIFKSNVTCGK